jgi:hypothetical protein
MAIWYHLWPFGIVSGHLVYFSHFGMFGPSEIWQPRKARYRGSNRARREKSESQDCRKVMRQ